MHLCTHLLKQKIVYEAAVPDDHDFAISCFQSSTREEKKSMAGLLPLFSRMFLNLVGIFPLLEFNFGN